MNFDTAEKIVDQLFNNLEHSTWYDEFPTAFDCLKDYRDDMIATVVLVLEGKSK